ncbi:CopG family transcriptional regulator [Candidatus Pacearchaeota archaeon]|jgi:Arc/MetJ-type ribon-helix-helix transcriptional regulator|nr:CopG family transcriptional regulator [Candidatus Pacearchaeota archaeon]|tara:strand:- start:623 stop:847 length:225 start_codon:yes stop_codon:yes gene_type:complete
MKQSKKGVDNKIEYGTISLPLPLIDKIKKKIKGTGMPSVSSYVSFVLRQVLSSDKFDEKEVREIKKKLKALGYD